MSIGFASLAVSCSAKYLPPGTSKDPANLNITGSVPTPFTVAAHPAMATVTDNGGRILVNPRAMAITFAGDAQATTVNTFVAQFMVSAEWTAMTGEYGIGAATAATPVSIATPPAASITDADVQTFLSTQLNAVGAPLGAPDNRTVYVIYYPHATTITAGSGAGAAVSCTDFSGYHDSFVDATSGLKIAYAVIARCGSDLVDDATDTITHELVEAVTDPDPNIDRLAFAGVRSDFAPWVTLSGGDELGDMCQQFASSNVTPADLPNKIQRTWSNFAASSSKDPCVPAVPGKVYFNTAPVVTDTITYTDFDGLATRTKGVSVAIGTSKTIELDLYSEAATGPWTVSILNLQATPHVTTSLDSTTGSNGGKLHLTITANSAIAASGELLVVKSIFNGVANFWPFVVTN